jgi:predicted small secreted protein
LPKIILTLAALLLLGACNTMRGAGQDVSTAGHAITNEANEAQSQM